MPRNLLERFVKKWRVEEREAAQQKDRAVSLGVLAGDHVEARPFQPPPGMGNAAVGQETVVQDVFIFDALAPLTFEVVRVGAGEHTGTSIDARRAGTAHIVEPADFSLRI